MPVLHMETSLVRDVAYQIQQASASLQQQTQQLNYLVQNLTNAWQGPSASIFMAEIQPLLQHLNQFANNGELLNQRLQREVDQWEQVANYLGGNVISGLYSGDEVRLDGITNQEVVQPPQNEFRLNPKELMDFDPRYSGKESGDVLRELNSFLAQTYQNGYCADNPELLQRLANVLGISYEESQQHYARLIELLHESGKSDVPDLSNAFSDHWGSRRQMLFGKVVGDSLNIHPAFAALLSPSGGIIGPGDGIASQFLDKDLKGMLNENAWEYHGATHDAAGYLYNNHAHLGPGYNYTGGPDMFSTENALSGQWSGYAYWAKQIGVPQTVLDTLLRRTRDLTMGTTKYVF